tara:strand:- start:4841 stop:5500 length:660 start_codon:yes stop_codon:yes gene_type:complete
MTENFLNFFLGGITLPFIVRCFLSVFLGGFISYALSLAGQSWAKSFSNVLTYLLLPLIGLIITSVISGNLSLSLGMVGALSIIRFRHPVKSPLELTIYFLLLTIGITISTSIGKALFLTILSMVIIYLYSLYISRKIQMKGGFPSLSFVRENPQYILDIQSNTNIPFLSESIYLMISNENRAKSIYFYKLAFGSMDEANKIKKDIETLDNLIEIKFTCI